MWKQRKKVAIYKPRTEASKETLVYSADTLTLDLQLLFKPPNLWSFVIAALAYPYSMKLG